MQAEVHSQYAQGHGAHRVLLPAERPAAAPCRAADPLHDDPRGVRRRGAHGAAGGERDGPFPGASGVQGRPEVRRLPQGQPDRGDDGRRAQRLHVARPRGVPHHLPRRGRPGGDRPADRLRRPAEDRRRGAGPRARRGDPGDRPRAGPAVGAGRAPDRPRGVRRAPARAPGAGSGRPPADVLARGDPRVPAPPVGGLARRRVPGRQPRARAGGPRAGRGVRALPVDLRRRRVRPGAAVRPADAGGAARVQPVAPAHVLPAGDRRARRRRRAPR